MKKQSKLEKIEDYRKTERNEELKKIKSNIPKGVLEGILFASIPAGVITGVITGVGLGISYFTKENVFQQPLFQLGGYGFIFSGLDFMALCGYGIGVVSEYADSPCDNSSIAIDDICGSIRKRKELKNMSQEEIYNRFISSAKK